MINEIWKYKQATSQSLKNKKVKSNKKKKKKIKAWSAIKKLAKIVEPRQKKRYDK